MKRACREQSAEATQKGKFVYKTFFLLFFVESLCTLSASCGIRKRVCNRCEKFTRLYASNGEECGEQGRECKKNKNEEVRKKYIFIENV